MSRTPRRLWRWLLHSPIKRNRFRDWFFGRPLPAFVALSLLYGVVGFGLITAVFFGPPYDVRSVWLVVVLTALLTAQDLGSRRRQHGMDEA